MSRPLILVSNDDGIHAEGVRALAVALEALGRVYVIAPATEQSATSHAMSLARPLRLRAHGPRRWSLDGTPADCVYVGLHLRDLLPERPAVIVSGINHGLNLGSDAFYSGTVAAAREAALRGVPGVAVSLAPRGDRPTAGRIAVEIVRALLGASVREPLLLNVNVPRGPVRGVKATRLGKRLYEEVVESRDDPRGAPYLWLGGASVSHPPSTGTDTAAYEEGYASVTPLSLDLFSEHTFDLTGNLVKTAAKRLKPESKPVTSPNRTRRKPS